ncbi:hypothetical protein V9T40_012530 [Parthenolecanium corni]|uniref:Transmembrane 9 superfamily member n=1 Tax=Parthenolecanium corni TaxID=536013 RepID=A0AAN9XZI5_9HEMI
MRTFLLIFSIVCALELILSSSNLPGLAPVNYCWKNESINAKKTCPSAVTLFVNRQNLEELIAPFEYHQLYVCLGLEKSSPVENLGQVIFRERKRPSPYEITKVYRPGDSKSKSKLRLWKRGVSLNHQHYWIVDNVPVTWWYDLLNNKQQCNVGSLMGCCHNKSQSKDLCSSFVGAARNVNDQYYGHLIICLSGENEEREDSFQSGHRIIASEVNSTIIRPRDFENLTFDDDEPMRFTKDRDSKTETKNSSRTSNHFFNIPKWLEILLFLNGMLTVIIWGRSHKDIARYNEKSETDQTILNGLFKIISRKDEEILELHKYYGEKIEALHFEMQVILFHQRQVERP